MKRGQITVGPEVLARLLQLPDHWKITGAKWDIDTSGLRIYVCGEGLHDCPDGVGSPRVTCVAVNTHDGYGGSGISATKIHWQMQI